jgi:hypothetical protein
MTRLALNDLLPNTDYGVRIRATNENEVSPWSTRQTLTTMSDVIVPATPTGVTWQAVGTAFHGEWNQVTTNVNTPPDTITVTRYEVELTNGTITKVVAVPAATSTIGNKVVYDLTNESNIALFGIAEPTLSMRVRAVDNKDLKSAWSASILASNDAPDAVQNFVATGITDGVTLTWDANTEYDLAGYRIWVGPDVDFTLAPTNLIFDGLATAFTYVTSTYAENFFVIKAYDKFGLESDPTSASATPISPFFADIVPPDVPTGLYASLQADPNGLTGTADLLWNAVAADDLDGYEIRYRRAGTTEGFERVTVGKDITTVRLILPTAYVSWEFYIRAFDWGANYSNWSAVYTSAAPSNTPPNNIASMTSTAGKDSITYNWPASTNTDLKNYEVTFSTSPTFASGNITYLTGLSNSLTVGGLTYGTTYYARVRAVDTGGLTSSSWSSTNTTSTGTMPSPTDGYAPSSSPTPNVTGRLNSLYVTWTPVETNSNGGAQNDAVTYDVHLSTTTGFTPSSGTKVTEVTAASALISNLPGTTTALSYGTTYYVKLVARDRDGSAAAGAQGSGTLSKVASTDVTSIGADLIVPGSGFIANLVINTGGSIQSSNYSSLSAGWKISPTGIEMNDAGSAVKVDALEAGTIGGSGGSGVINIGAGTSLIFNGGYLKSNTYTVAGAPGTSYNAAATAGFYLGNDGLVIAQGAIKANALISDTLTSTTITLGTSAFIQTANYNGTSGFRLSSSGLEIPNGALDISKITVGNNTIAGGAITSITGNKITTGTIQSSYTTTVGGFSQPKWIIGVDSAVNGSSGAAAFSDVSVRGKLIVGDPTATNTSGSTSQSASEVSYVQSGNYYPGIRGWKIDAQGNAELLDATLRGTLTAALSSKPNQKIVIRDDTNGGVIEMWSGVTSEVLPTVIDPSSTGTWPYLQIKTGTTSTLTSRAYLTMYSNTAASGAFISMTADTINLVNSGNTLGLYIDDANNVVRVNGTFSAMGSVNLGTVNTSSANIGTLSGNTYVTGLFRSEQNITTNYNGSTAGGFFDLTRTTAVGAAWNSSGRIVAASSSIRYKENVSPMTLEQAKIVLDMQAVTFDWKADQDRGTDRQPGFIAEQASEAGAELWVVYNSDGQEESVRYPELTAAHNVLMNDLYKRIEELETKLAGLNA